MTHQAPPKHFQGKSPFEHLKDARQKGKEASEETHGVELSGFLNAVVDSSKDTAFAFLIMWAASLNLPLSRASSFLFFLLFSFGWTIWKAGRSALLGWARLERLHRLIEEERYEIEHHRAQEKEELTQMYRAKGLKGKLLEEVVDVLMADDNRLLRVMLEEELGLSLEVYEHPLKQAFGAALATFLSASLFLFAFYFWQGVGLLSVAFLILSITSYKSAHFEKRSRLNSLVWNIALSGFVTTAVYFLGKLLILWL